MIQCLYLDLSSEFYIDMVCAKNVEIQSRTNWFVVWPFVTLIITDSESCSINFSKESDNRGTFGFGKDLSVLVIDQGTIVDRIDYNIQDVAATVEEGFKQLEKAERSQRKGGMVQCATILIIMCFVMLVLLVLKEILF